MKDKLPKQSHSKVSLSLLKNLLLISTSGIALIILLFFVGVWRAGGRFVSGIESIFNTPPSTPQVDVPTLIVNQIRGASELTTAVFVMEAVVPTSQDRKLGDFVLATTKLLYVAHGEVRAGIDLSNLTLDNVKVSNNNIQISLPPPQILDSKVDVNRSSVYDYDRGFFSLGPDAAPELQTLAQRKTLQKMVNNACSEGVLEEANERAKVAIIQLLTTAGYEQVEVKTTSPIPQACQLSLEKIQNPESGKKGLIVNRKDFSTINN